MPCQFHGQEPLVPTYIEHWTKQQDYHFHIDSGQKKNTWGCLQTIPPVGICPRLMDEQDCTHTQLRYIHCMLGAHSV